MTVGLVTSIWILMSEYQFLFSPLFSFAGVADSAIHKRVSKKKGGSQHVEEMR